MILSKARGNGIRDIFYIQVVELIISWNKTKQVGFQFSYLYQPNKDQKLIFVEIAANKIKHNFANKKNKESEPYFKQTITYQKEEDGTRGPEYNANTDSHLNLQHYIAAQNR